MNIDFIKKAEHSSSAIEAYKALDKIEDQLITLISSSKLKDYIKKSPIKFVITLIANPTEHELEGAYSHTHKINSIVSAKIANDTNIYVFRNRLGVLEVPETIDNILIAMGLCEYSVESPVKNQDNDADDEKPVFIAKDPKYTFDEVLLDNETKDRIIRALAIIKNRDLIFNTWGYSKLDKATKSIICFYGPAGTGKTMTAEAIGDYLNKKVVHSSYAQIESKWVGEGAKNLHAIFKFAEDNDAVLFFDEADSFLSSRLQTTESGSDKHYNRMSNELFQLLEEFNGCVIFSTNLLTDVDQAFKSRIIDSIEFKLPDLDTRIQLIKKHIPSNFPLNEAIKDTEFKELSELIDGFSGRDIRKSMLLSLAGAAVRYTNDNIHGFAFEDIKVGFLEVKHYKDSMSAAEGNIPIEIVDDIIHRQTMNENIIDIAIYSLYADGILKDSERILINELSKTLLGVTYDSEISLPTRSLEEICKEVVEQGISKEILDTSIKVLTIDGNLDSTEIEFLNKLIKHLSYPDSIIDCIIDYAKHSAELNQTWENLMVANNIPGDSFEEK